MLCQRLAMLDVVSDPLNMAVGRELDRSMGDDQRIIEWLRADEQRVEALKLAAALDLNDWCIAAGFVRNLVWDKLHDRRETTPLNDIDLIHFDLASSSKARDSALEQALHSQSALPWSVKNQARMHIRNGDPQYASTEEAMRYWVEVETAIGARLNSRGDIELVAPFGVGALFAYTITMNPHRLKPADFAGRLHTKRWLEHWPKLRVDGGH